MRTGSVAPAGHPPSRPGSSVGIPELTPWNSAGPNGKDLLGMPETPARIAAQATSARALRIALSCSRRGPGPYHSRASTVRAGAISASVLSVRERVIHDARRRIPSPDTRSAHMLVTLRPSGLSEPHLGPRTRPRPARTARAPLPRAARFAFSLISLQIDRHDRWPAMRALLPPPSTSPVLSNPSLGTSSLDRARERMGHARILAPEAWFAFWA
ncbi:hypothetical protein BD413DRAFT_523847, partial [Trametes elegans]